MLCWGVLSGSLRGLARQEDKLSVFATGKSVLVLESVVVMCTEGLIDERKRLSVLLMSVFKVMFLVGTRNVGTADCSA